MLGLAGRDQLVGDRPHRARRDREADAVVAAGVALDLRVDADHVAAHVEQRPTRVAVIDRRVGLDGARDRIVVRCRDGAVEGADDAGGHRLRQAERAADRRDALTDLHRARGAERQRMQLRRVDVDLDHRDVGRVVGTDERRLRRLAGLEADLDRGRPVDDVGVRDDVALRVDDEAGAFGLRLAAAGVGAGRVALIDGDVDDAGRRVLVELGQCAGRRGDRLRRRLRRNRGDDRPGAAVRARGGRVDRCARPAAEGEGRPDGRDPAEKNLSVHWVIAPGFLIVVRTLCPFRLGSG